MIQNILPIARSRDLVVQEMSNELLVYNLTNHKALCLNSTSAFIWKHCDGKTPVAQLTGLLNSTFNLQVEEDFIWLALDELNKVELIQNYANKFDDRISRRKALLNYALPMAMLPAITTLIAPMAAQAQSGVCVANPSLSCITDPDCELIAGPCIPAGTCSATCDTSTNCCQIVVIDN